MIKNPRRVGLHMRGLMSLDFFLSMVVVVILATMLFGLAFAQSETSSELSLKLKAEAISMGIGSAINTFAAINPEIGSDITIRIKPVVEASKVTADDPPSSGGGWPRVSLEISNCMVTIDATKDIITTNISFFGIESNHDSFVLASYPLVDVSGDIELLCGESFFVEQNAELEVTAL